MNAENSLPEWKMIEKYTNAATKLLGHIKERSLDGYCKRDMLMKLAMTGRCPLNTIYLSVAQNSILLS
jgi:hypothetical protein